MDIRQFNNHLNGIVGVGMDIPTHVRRFLRGRRTGTPKRTRAGEPYDPRLFKHSSNFAEHVSKFIVAYRGVTPRSVHNLSELAEQLDDNDRYKRRIARLNGATRDGNISLYIPPEPPAKKAEDEPVQRSTQRLVEAFRLLREFLEEYANEIEIRDEHRDIEIDFNDQVVSWREDVVGELLELMARAELELWLGQIAEDAKDIGAILGRFAARLQSISQSLD